MKHVETIEALIETMMKSENFHALLVQSAPGWSKSTTIDKALKRLKAPFVAMGSFTTALHFYNTLVQHPRSIIVLDDCIFSDVKTMTLLKAATWASAGGGAGTASRRVAWGSTSDKVLTPFVDFSGKVILLTNSLPKGKEMQAFLSRCLSYRISFSDVEIKKMLLFAAESSEYFRNVVVAREVAAFLINNAANADFSQLNLRTLHLGYELAITQPAHWKDLLPNLLPRVATHPLPATSLNSEAVLPVRKLEASFIATTGRSRRTFYYRRKKAGLSRTYRAKDMD